MAKKKETVEVEVKEKKSKTFKVYDSNGKQVREVDSEEKAKELAKVYGGKVK